MGIDRKRLVLVLSKNYFAPGRGSRPVIKIAQGFVPFPIEEFAILGGHRGVRTSGPYIGEPVWYWTDDEARHVLREMASVHSDT